MNKNDLTQSNLILVIGKQSYQSLDSVLDILFICSISTLNILRPMLLKENFSFLKPRPYFLFEIRLSTHREQFGEDRRPLRAI